MSVRHEDNVIAVLAQFKDGLMVEELVRVAGGNHPATRQALADLISAGVVERVQPHPFIKRLVCRLTGLERPPIVPPKRNPVGGVRLEPRLKPAPRPRKARPAPVAPPDLPATWRRRWGRLDGRRELEVLVTADAEWVYVTQWQRNSSAWIPLKGALRLKKEEANALLEALTVAIEYAR